jgi:uncharacterized membrane protein
VVIDSVEELGLGLALAALLLLVLGGIDASMSGEELVGRVVVCGLAVAIGVSVGTAQLGGDADDGMSDDTLQPAGFAGQLALAGAGRCWSPRTSHRPARSPRSRGPSRRSG